jgi:hypothetical protein
MRQPPETSQQRSWSHRSRRCLCPLAALPLPASTTINGFDLPLLRKKFWTGLVLLILLWSRARTWSSATSSTWTATPISGGVDGSEFPAKRERKTALVPSYSCSVVFAWTLRPSTYLTFGLAISPLADSIDGRWTSSQRYSRRVNVNNVESRSLLHHELVRSI